MVVLFWNCLFTAKVQNNKETLHYCVGLEILYREPVPKHLRNEFV